MNRTCLLLFAIPVLCMSDVTTIAAQPLTSIDKKADVFREQIDVTFPLPYLDVRKPEPPVVGFYAWRVSFGGAADLTVVLRADTALRTSSSWAVVRASSLRRCPPNATSVMDCTAPIRGRARVGADAIIVEITDPDFVKLVRQRGPEVLVRHVFEPGGRFRVDHIGMRYK